MARVQKQELEEEAWDKKKIFIGLLAIIFIVGVAVGLKQQILDANVVSVKGVSTKKDSTPIPTPGEKANVSFSPGATFSQKLEAIKKEIQSLNVSEVTSTSPQVQKILKDIKALENYPKNQAKEACLKICEGL